jgi:hypothetical protein
VRTRLRRDCLTASSLVTLARRPVTGFLSKLIKKSEKYTGCFVVIVNLSALEI